MDRSRLEIAPEICLDARRAVFLRETRTLIVADLHLGYAWAHRHGGQLLPISAREDSLARLMEMVADYAPRELVLLGDIVHRAVPVAALKEELCGIFHALNNQLQLVLIAGNHDRNLARLLDECGLPANVRTEFQSGKNLLVHGDARLNVCSRRAEINANGGRVFIGHEHPAITLSGGVGTSAKCPCFLISPEVIVLPAFSRWAAGTNVQSHPRMSPWAAGIVFSHAVAAVGGKLLSVPLHAPCG